MDDGHSSASEQSEAELEVGEETQPAGDGAAEAPSTSGAAAPAGSGQGPLISPDMKRTLDQYDAYMAKLESEVSGPV